MPLLAIRVFIVFMLLVTSVAHQTAGQEKSMLALTNVTVIDGNGGPPLPERTIVISGERIADIFPTGTKPLPRGATTMNLKGHFVMPGLIDSHYHLTPGLRSKEVEEALRRFVFIGGITAVRDMAGDAVALAELAKIAADANVQSPRIYYSALMAGPAFLSVDRRVEQASRGHTRGEAPWIRAIKPETDIAKAVSEAKATGATGIKIYTDLSPETVAKITTEAHRQGLKVWSHASIYPGKPSDAVRADVDVISHSNLVIPETMAKVPERYIGSYPMLDYSTGIERKEISDLLALMLQKGTYLDPTLVVTARLANGKPGDIFRDPKQMLEWTYLFTLRAHIRKIPIVAGTDVFESPATRDFPNLHSEMELLVNKVGLTPLEAITTATRNGAQVLGIADSVGTVATGKIADLVILSADPTIDIRNTTRIEYVVKGGKVHQRDTSKDQRDLGDPAEIAKLRELVRAWDEATVKGDATTLDRLLAVEFTFVGGVRRAAYLDFIKAKTTDTYVESAVSENVQVQVYGDAAVVTATGVTKGKNRGQPYESRYLFIDVWVKRDGRWQCVKVYSNPITN
ncbi:MAG TPA: amidohydrolase family protein [Pyrinomonadaceae bacterium]|nr:amidohydrolase family protein [Pyrinomonadaceae bacterium]